MQAVLCSAGKERRDVVYDRLGPTFGGDKAMPAPRTSKARRAKTVKPEQTNGRGQTRKSRKPRKPRDRHAQPGDDQILSRRVGATEIMDAIAGRSDAQKELTAETERAALEALVIRATQIYPPPTEEWHAPARAEDLKAFAAADWLIHSDAITRSQIDALPTVDNRLNAEEFQTMMCATVGGMIPMFAAKEGKPIRVLKAGTGGQEVRTDGALKLPLDARATNLLAADTGGHSGSFSGRHNGLRDLIYDEVARAGGTASREVELGTEHGLAETSRPHGRYVPRETRRASARSGSATETRRPARRTSLKRASKCG